MNNKGFGIVGVVLSVLIIGGLLGAGFVFKDDLGKFLFEQSAVPTTGCQFITNPDDPQQIYTEIIQGGSNYQCNVSQCIVSGSINVDNPSPKEIVIFRYDGNYEDGVYADTNGDGYLEYWSYDTKSTGSSSNKVSLPFLTSTNFPIYLYVGKLYIYYDADHAYKYVGPNGGSGPPFKQGPNSICPNALEVCKTIDAFEADFNFCPVSDPNFPYCNGANNHVVGRGSYQTDTYKLLFNDQLQFDPRDSDNSQITDKTIYVKKYDCSCLPAIETGDACSSDQKYCQPGPSQAPRTFNSGSYTYKRQQCENYCDVPCQSTSNGDWRCPGVNADYTKYLVCDGTQQIGQSTCQDFNTVKSCTGGQECFAEDGSHTGLGGCKCPNDPCISGSKEVLSETTYRECVPNTATGCVNWGPEKSCPSSSNGALVFDQATQSCVCPPQDSCDPTFSQCLDSSTVEKCTPVSIAGKTCYQIGSPKSCSSDKECVGDSCVLKQGCQYNNPVCGIDFNCESNVCVPKTTGEYCTVTESPYCVSKTQLQKCVSQGGGVYKWQTVVAESNKECSNGRFVCKTSGDYCKSNSQPDCASDSIARTCVPDGTGCYKWEETNCGYDLKCFQGNCESFGCGFNTPGYECSDVKDSWDEQVEQCISNECQPAQDIFTATLADYQTGKTKCYGNQIVKVNKYAIGTSTNFVNVYRWEAQESCTGQAPICLGEKLE